MKKYEYLPKRKQFVTLNREICGFELTKLIVLLIFRILRNNDVFGLEIGVSHAEFQLKILSIGCVTQEERVNFSTICLSKTGNKKPTSRSFAILFSVMGRLETAL